MPFQIALAGLVIPRSVSFRHASYEDRGEKTVAPDFADFIVICEISSHSLLKYSLVSLTVEHSWNLSILSNVCLKLNIPLIIISDDPFFWNSKLFLSRRFGCDIKLIKNFRLYCFVGTICHEMSVGKWFEGGRKFNFGALTSKHLLLKASTILLGHVDVWSTGVFPCLFVCCGFWKSCLFLFGVSSSSHILVPACVILLMSGIFPSMIRHGAKGSPGLKTSVFEMLARCDRLQVCRVYKIVL